MSMICTISALTEEELRTLLDWHSDMERSRREKEDMHRQKGFFSRLFSRLPEKCSFSEMPISADRNALSIDKAWSGIHFLLTGTDEEGEDPEYFLASGGLPLSEVWGGYGPPRVFDREESAKIASHLASIDGEALAKRYKRDDLFEYGVYPFSEQETDVEILEYITNYYVELRAFMAKSSAAGCGLLVHLS